MILYENKVEIFAVVKADFYFKNLMINDRIVTHAIAPKVLSSLTSSRL